MDMSLSKLQEMVKDREACCAAVHRVTKESDTCEQLNSNNLKQINWVGGWRMLYFHQKQHADQTVDLTVARLTAVHELQVWSQDYSVNNVSDWIELADFPNGTSCGETSPTPEGGNFEAIKIILRKAALHARLCFENVSRNRDVSCQPIMYTWPCFVGKETLQLFLSSVQIYLKYIQLNTSRNF